MLPAPFHNGREFRAAFVRNLGHVLTHDDIGEFILVLANASYDEELFHLLEGRLYQRYQELSASFDDLRKQQQELTDDMLVFQKLLELGFENLTNTRFREIGPWRVQFNQLRSFKPARMSQQAVTGIKAPFNPGAFNFNKSCLKNELLWSGELIGVSCDLLYNKFPFADLHGLLVVAGKENKSQFTTAKDNEYIWRLTELLGATLPGVGFGYNAYGAYASVNHQHYHMYVCDSGRYPVESRHWQHNGGTEKYPLACQVYTDSSEATSALGHCHQQNISYNLLYRPGKLYLTPRAKQGSYAHADWTAGFAWAEIAGAITTFSEKSFLQLDLKAIETEFTKLVLT